MALVASGIANDGVVMRPHLIERIADPAGRTISTTASRVWTTATDPATAATVTDVMIGRRDIGIG